MASLLNMTIPAIRYLGIVDTRGSSINKPPIPLGKTNIPYNVAKLNYSKLYHRGSPLVLIYHTHTTECYKYEPAQINYRSRDFDVGVVSIGNLIAKTLYEEYDVETLQIFDVYDDPEYNGAYDRSLTGIQDALAKYPSIKYIFDVHRDAPPETETGMTAFTATIDGKSAVKIETVVAEKAVYFEQNLAFADQIENAMNAMYPGLFKRQVIMPYYYNQFLQPQSLLFEVGGCYDSPEAARYSAILLSRVLGETIGKRSKTE
jgi:stage II sporulation protein P